jgi:zinc transport system substrate-binding protein
VRYSRIVLAFSLLPLAVTAAGCGSGDTAGGERTGEQIVAAFYPLAYAAREVAGQDAEVRNLTPAGAEPHDLELAPSDVAAVLDADLVVYLGRGFQPGLEQAIADRDGPSLDLLEGQELIGGGAGAHESAGGGALDPHVWLDPLRFAAMARAIATSLGDPAAADDLVARLEELDGRFEAGLERCERREIVTSHAAFGYLAERYGLTQVALLGLSPEAEPTPKDLAALVDEVEATGATTIFFEPLVSSALAETVARETGARAAVLDPLEGLTAAQEDAGDDYFSVMEENLRTLREALGCT